LNLESPKSDNRKRKKSAFISSSLFKTSPRVGLHGLLNNMQLEMQNSNVVKSS